MKKPIIWYFQINICPLDKNDWSIDIVSKSYYDRMKTLDDVYISDKIKLILPNGFNEVSRSIFEYNGSPAAARKSLVSAGFIEKFLYTNPLG